MWKGRTSASNAAIGCRRGRARRRLPDLAAELVRLNVTSGRHRIVRSGLGGQECDENRPHRHGGGSANPVRRAWSPGLARPGGNITGLSSTLSTRTSREATGSYSRKSSRGSPGGPAREPHPYLATRPRFARRQRRGPGAGGRAFRSLKRADPGDHRQVLSRR